MHKFQRQQKNITRRPVSGVQSGETKLKGLYTCVMVTIWEWCSALSKPANWKHTNQHFYNEDSFALKKKWFTTNSKNDRRGLYLEKKK